MVQFTIIPLKSEVSLATLITDNDFQSDSDDFFTMLKQFESVPVFCMRVGEVLPVIDQLRTINEKFQESLANIRSLQTYLKAEQLKQEKKQQAM